MIKIKNCNVKIKNDLLIFRIFSLLLIGLLLAAIEADKACAATAYSPLDTVVKHTPNYVNDYTWFSYTSTNAAKLSRQYILLWVNGGEVNYEDCLSICQMNTRDWGRDPRLSKFIIVTVGVPRRMGTETVPNRYPVTFPSYVFSSQTEEQYYRPDLKINAILDSFIDELNNGGMNVNRRVVFYGFSNTASFANRYTLLHPDRVRAYAIGGVSALTFPLRFLNNKTLTWPTGVYDYRFLTKRAFNSMAYFLIPKFIFVGELDIKNSQVGYPPNLNTEIFSLEQAQFMYDIAADDPDRLRIQCDIMRSVGDNVTFKLYPGIGHDFSEEWWNDMINFLELNSYNSPDLPVITPKPNSTTSILQLLLD